MDYRTGKMKNLYTRLKNLIDRFDLRTVGMIIIVTASSVLISYEILGPSLEQVILGVLISAYLTILFDINRDNIESRIKIDKLKPYILLELEFILISLIINFAQLYVIYFEFLKPYDFNRLFQIIENRKKNTTDYLLFKEIYSLLNKLNDFHYVLETDKEIKPIIKPVHMTLFTSVLTSLTPSSFERAFVKNMLDVWHEINELNKKIEVLKGLSQPDPSLIRSISEGIERIAIKIDEILQKEETKI